MTLIEIYTLLFTDTVYSNFAFIPSSEIILGSMKIFNTYNPYIVILVASFGFFVSCILNYIFGLLCYKMLAPTNSSELNDMEDKIASINESKYLTLILCLSAIPFFGKFIILFTGFCRTRIVKTLVIACGVKFIYYSLFMLT